MIEATVRHELQTMGNTSRRIFSMVRNKQQLRFTFANQHINKTANKLAIERIKPLQWFVENKQRRMFHQCADDQRQTLLSPGKTMERSVSRAFINAENIQPLLHQFCWRSETA